MDWKVARINPYEQQSPIDTKTIEKPPTDIPEGFEAVWNGKTWVIQPTPTT